MSIENANYIVVKQYKDRNYFLISKIYFKAILGTLRKIMIVSLPKRLKAHQRLVLGHCGHFVLNRVYAALQTLLKSL